MTGFRLGLADLERLAADADRVEDFEETLSRAIRRRPADVSAVVEFFDVPTGDAFDVEPQKAIDYFKAKGLQPSFSYADMIGGEHDHAFTVAKMMKVDMLGQVRASLDSAMANGTPFQEWADSIIPVLQSGGWWGRKKVVDPVSGRLVVAQLGSPWRLETIFRTNMQTAYAAGQWDEINSQAAVAPFLMYDAVDDLRTRPLHASWDRKVLPVTSAWWRTHYPPNGYNCRCGVIQLDKEQVEALGLQVAGAPPDDGTYLWTNPRTGYAQAVPNGIDPGFNRNAGIGHHDDAKKLLAEKIAALPADLKAAANAAQAQSSKALDNAVIAAIQAQDELASIQARAALSRMQAKVGERLKQAAALEQLDEIKAVKATTGPAGYQAKALATLKQSDEWLELKPTEQVAQVNALAADLKKKADTAKAVSLYKTQVVAGKNPSPAAAKAFASLPEADQQALLKKIDDEKAAIQAAKEAEAAAAAAKAAEEAQTSAGPSKAAALVDGDPPDPATMVVVGRKTKGGTEGAVYQDTSTGARWLVKFNGSEDAVHNEVLASKLYSLAGLEAPELHAITIGGRPALASRMIDGIVEVPARTLAATDSVLDGFGVDAWLANWDVAGLSFDNIVLVGGRALRIDVGGALRYRAVGGLKGSAFGNKVGEIDSLRDGTNPQARQVFGAMTPAKIEASVERVLSISDADIRAVVLRYGPPDLAVRNALAEQMVERKRDLERRFPAAAERVRARQAGAQQAPSQAAARVTAAEQDAVDASRVNGFGFATDSDQIEDNMVIVHAFKRADGSDATRGFLKLMPGASAELLKRVKGAAGDAPSVDLSGARQSILDAIKSINFRADKLQPLDAKVVGRIEAMQKAVAAAMKDLDEAIAKAADPLALTTQRQILDAWASRVAGFLDDARAGKAATKIPGKFPTDAIPDSLIYAEKGAKAAAPALKWQRVTGDYQFETADFNRSFAAENGGRATVRGTSVRYEAALPDGTKITYFPHDSSVAYAMQGVLKIDTPGRGVDPTTRVFSSLDEIGLNGARAAEVDRQHLYLNAFARIALLRRSKALADFAAITERGAEGVKAKLAMLRKETGVDVAASDGWRSVDGVRQAFGHGRAYQLRPDLQPAELEQLNRTHVVYHNPQGLGTDAGSGVFDRLKSIIEGGGMFASLTDRVRRGVPLQGSSVASDLASGGGDYHFTRIRSRAAQGGTGVYWKASVLRRMDAITYDSDQFGRTTPGHVEQYRQGQNVDSFKAVARSSGNETIFKGGLSIFDDLDRIVLSSEAEVKAAIAWLKSKGYATWPDGRSLEQVIMTKAKHSAKP